MVRFIKEKKFLELETISFQFNLTIEVMSNQSNFYRKQWSV